MTATPRSSATRRGPRSWVVAAGVLLVVGLICVAVGLHVRHHPLAGPVAAPSTLTTTPAPTVPTVAVVARSTPVSLRVPALALSVALSTLGLNPDGTVEVPTNTVEPGWFKLGPSPGQIGSAVILGHVDSSAGAGVFFALRTLQAGDQVQVTLADGALANFSVTSVATYTKTQFPAQEVYASHGTAALQLVTCGGTFDSQTGHYLSNIVVYTAFVSATTPTTPPPAATPAPGPRPPAAGAVVRI